MSLKGNVRSLAAFSASLRQLPKVAAQKVTAACAPIITGLARATFAASESAYGDPWKPGAEGQKVTLRQTGALARYVVYVGIGTKLRVALGVTYAKYQIGRRPVFPRQGEPLPVAYVRAMQAEARRILAAELGGAS